MATDTGDEFEDIELTCSECGREFVHTKVKQEFYASVGLKNLPKRCPECREKRRNNGKRRGAASRPKAGQRDRAWRSGPVQKYEAVCAECGKRTLLKFKPTGVRPVYCDECFRKRKAMRM